MTFSVIILTYNSSNTILDCLESICSTQLQDLNEGEIIVADNFSKDNTLEIVNNFKKKHPKIAITIIHNKFNYGFAKGINQAVKNSKGQFFLLLNPDSTIIDGSILNLIKTSKNNNNAVIGGKIFGEKSAGDDFGLLHVLSLMFTLDEFLKLRISPTSTKKVDWVSGACMLISKEVFTRLKGLDESYFMYMEDADFCLRARKQGIEVLFSPDITIRHKLHESSSKKFAISQIFEGIISYSQKHHAKLTQFLIKFILKTKANLLILYSQVTKNQKLKETYSTAIKKL